MPRHSAPSAKQSRRPALPLFLYDLRAASQTLPPAAVLPEQFYSPPAATDKVHGEVALMRAVLEDAINCFQKQPLKSGRRAHVAGGVGFNRGVTACAAEMSNNYRFKPIGYEISGLRAED